LSARRAWLCYSIPTNAELLHRTFEWLKGIPGRAKFDRLLSPFSGLGIVRSSFVPKLGAALRPSSGNTEPRQEPLRQDNVGDKKYHPPNPIGHVRCLLSANSKFTQKCHHRTLWSVVFSNISGQCGCLGVSASPLRDATSADSGVEEQISPVSGTPASRVRPRRSFPACDIDLTIRSVPAPRGNFLSRS
jgi:hypothetical protein